MLNQPLAALHVPLHKRVAEVLEEMIRRGELTKQLPPEKLLAQQLDISRPVLRQALATLDQQGLLRIVHGKRTQVLKKMRPARRPLREIVVAAPKASDDQPGQAPLMDELRRRLEAKDYIWTQLYDRRLSSRSGPALLSQSISQRKPACLLLVHSTEAMQKWAQEHVIRSVVLGTSFPDIDLPSIDTDYHALGWHAAGQLVKAGHRHVSLLLPPNSPGGDRATRQGLLEYFQSVPGIPCTFSLDSASSHPPEFRAAIDRILNRRTPPTAFFSFLPIHTLTLLTHLLQKGLRIPRDVAVISRDSEFYLDAVTPEPARYQRNESAFITQTIRLIEKVSAGIPLPKKTVRLIPSFKPGRTIQP